MCSSEHDISIEALEIADGDEDDYDYDMHNKYEVE